MRVAICDDELTAHGELIDMLNEYGSKRKITICADRFNGGAGLLRSSENYDIIFMDYRMDELNGIAVSRKIRESNNSCAIIFVSAYPEAALDSFEVGTFRFLKKPVDKSKLFAALDDYMRSLEHDDILILKTGDRTWKIKMSDIIYAEAKGRHTIVRTTEKFFEIHIHLKVIESRLPAEKFIRCHRSYIAGFAHITNHTNKEIIFDNGEMALIGKVYASAFKEAFQQYIIRYNERQF